MAVVPFTLAEGTVFVGAVGAVEQPHRPSQYFFSRVAPESEDGISGSTFSGAILSGPEPEAPISPRTAGVMGMRKCVFLGSTEAAFRVFWVVF